MLVRVARLELESGIPSRKRSGTLVEVCFFPHADPVVNVQVRNTEASHRLKFSEWLEEDVSFRIIIEMMREMAKESRPKRVRSWERGARAGLKNFEVFMTGAFEGEHRVEIWAYNEASEGAEHFVGTASTEAILTFCDELELLLDEDAVRRGGK